MEASFSDPVMSACCYLCLPSQSQRDEDLAASLHSAMEDPDTHVMATINIFNIENTLSDYKAEVSSSWPSPFHPVRFHVIASAVLVTYFFTTMLLCWIWCAGFCVMGLPVELTDCFGWLGSPVHFPSCMVAVGGLAA